MGTVYGRAALEASGLDLARVMALDLTLDETPGDRIWSQLTALESLDLSHATVTRLPSVGAASCLKELRLNGARLDADLALADHLPPSLERLELRGLCADQLGALDLSRLPKLTWLDISDTGLEALPPELAALDRLEVLRAHRAHGARLSGAAFPAALKELHLGSSGAPLKALPESLAALPALERLLVTGGLEALPVGFERLEELTLVGHGLTDAGLWPALAGEALRRLVIGGNALAELPASLARHGGLRHLEAPGCPIRRLDPALGSLAKLRVLDLSDGELVELPDSVAGWTALEQLRLPRNRLRYLPAGLGELPSLREIDLEANALDELPADFIERGAPRELILTGNAFHKSGLAALERLRDRVYRADPFAHVHDPRPAEAPAREPRSPSIVESSLDPALVAQLERLGATERPDHDGADSPTTLATAGGPRSVSGALRRLLFGLRWSALLDGHRPDGSELWSVDPRLARAIPDFECTWQRPYVLWAEAMGGNRFLLIALDDARPGDPAVFEVDHEDSRELRAQVIAASLSGLLAGLERAAEVPS